MKKGKIITIALATFLLTACASNTVEVDLTDEEIQVLKDEIVQIENDIKNYDSSDLEAVPPYLLTIDMASTYEKMGKLGKAMDIYEDAIDDDMIGSALYNNLGRLYEKVGRYDDAIEMYQRILDEYYDQGYLYDITWAYIKMGDRKNAEKYFNAWQLEYNKTDEQTQGAIKKLRDAERNS